MSDLTEDDLPSFDVVWLAAERAPLTSRRGLRVGFVRSALTTRRGWIALASWLPSATALFAALRSAHSFPIPAGAGDRGVGYLLQSPDGISLCLVLREIGAAGRPGSLVHSAFGPVACASIAAAERSGLVAVGGAASYQTDGNVFVALIPTGATVEVTDDGTTTPVPVNDRIATGVALPTATLTTNIAGVAQTTRLAASAERWWPPAPSSAPEVTSSTSSVRKHGTVRSYRH